MRAITRSALACAGTRPAPAAVLAALALLLALAPAARAEHEVYYRFTVLGFVKDAQGKPVAGRTVKLVRDRTGFSYLGETDARGSYLLAARLGDESAGERLTLTIGPVTVRLTARFDPANRVDERGTRVDVEGARAVERPAWFHSTLAQMLGAPAR